MSASKATIVITEFMDTDAVDALRADFAVHYDPELVDHPQSLQPLLADARALIVRNRTQVYAQLLASAPRLETVGRLGVGLDNIDMEACRQRDIAVHPATGANARAVAEYVIGAALLALRGVFGSSAEVANGQWPRTALSSGREANGKTLGLVGFGDIGQLTARLARALDLQVVAYDPFIPDNAALWSAQGVRPLDLKTLLAQADIISLHVPLNDATRNLLDRAALASTKPGAILINTARGGIIDEAALAEALHSGHLGGAIIDVFAQEPLPAASVLAGAPRLWLTPHIAGLTSEANVRVSALVGERVSQTLKRKQSPH